MTMWQLYYMVISNITFAKYCKTLMVLSHMTMWQFNYMVISNITFAQDCTILRVSHDHVAV